MHHAQEHLRSPTTEYAKSELTWPWICQRAAGTAWGRSDTWRWPDSSPRSRSRGCCRVWPRDGTLRALCWSWSPCLLQSAVSGWRRWLSPWWRPTRRSAPRRPQGHPAHTKTAGTHPQGHQTHTQRQQEHIQRAPCTHTHTHKNSRNTSTRAPYTHKDRRNSSTRAPCTHKNRNTSTRAPCTHKDSRNTSTRAPCTHKDSRNTSTRAPCTHTKTAGTHPQGHPAHTQKQQELFQKGTNHTNGTLPQGHQAHKDKRHSSTMVPSTQRQQKLF